MPVSAWAIFASGIRALSAAMAACLQISSTCSWVKVANTAWAFRISTSFASRVSTESILLIFTAIIYLLYVEFGWFLRCPILQNNSLNSL